VALSNSAGKSSLSEKRDTFEFLEHTADIYIAAHGRTLEEAFENAALATFETMTNTKKVTPQHEETVNVEGHDVKELLYNWLEALLVQFETTEKLYSKFRITCLEKVKRGYKLQAKILGEKFNPNKHLGKVGVKAITYHKMEIIKTPYRVTAKFVLDI